MEKTGADFFAALALDNPYPILRSLEGTDAEPRGTLFSYIH